MLPLEISSRINAEISKGSNLFHGIIKFWVYGNTDDGAKGSGTKLVWSEVGVAFNPISKG